MGMFKVDVTLTNPKDQSLSFSEKFWVDRKKRLRGQGYTFDIL